MNSGSVYEPLLWEVRFLRERGGDRSIGEANLRKGLAPSMAGTPRAWLAHLAPSSSKIIAPNRGTGVFRNELRKCVRTFHGRFVSCGNGEGIEALAKPIFVRGLPLQWLVRPVPGWRTLRSLHPKSLRQIGELGFFGTNSGSVYEPFMGGSFLAGTGRGIEALAKPIFVRAQPFNGWHAPCLAGAPCALFIQNHCAKSGNWGFRNELRKRVRTFHGRFVYCGNGEGIEALA